jgi:hypothetical protein
VDITSANAVLTISPRAAGLIGSGGAFTVEGFASDDAFMADAVDTAEAVMGVDGKMSVGYTPYITKQTVTLQADSPSVTLFEAIVGAQNALRQPMFLDAVLALPAVQKSYIFKLGALTRVTPFPAGKKVLQPVQYEISWETVVAVPLAA